MNEILLGVQKRNPMVKNNIVNCNFEIPSQRNYCLEDIEKEKMKRSIGKSKAIIETAT